MCRYLFGQAAQPSNYLFTGKELDSSGLYYYGARYYDPLIGRFITADPTIARPYDSQDLNRYSYCRNNPLIYIDPSGLSWLGDLIGAIIGFIVGIFVGAVAGPGAGITAGMAAYSAVSAAISAAQAGANAWQVAGIALAAAAASYVGAQIGGAFGSNIGGGQFGASVFAGMFGGAAGGATEAALSGGDVVQSTLWGGAIGTGMGIMMGGFTASSAWGEQAQVTNTSGDNAPISESLRQQKIRELYNAGKFQDAIDYAYDAYDISAGKGIAKYDPNLPLYKAATTTAGSSNNVTSLSIGPGAFRNPFTGSLDASRLPGTLYHEGIHVSGITSGSIWSISRGAAEARAYGRTLVYSSRLELSHDVRSYYEMRYRQETARR